MGGAEFLLAMVIWFGEEKTVKDVGRFNVEGWAARDISGILSPFNFTRRNCYTKRGVACLLLSCVIEKVSVFVVYSLQKGY